MSAVAKLWLAQYLEGGKERRKKGTLFVHD